MKVVVPMAGRGSRFGNAGVPKPLIQVADKPMLGWALKSLEGVAYSEIIFVALREHEVQYGLTKIISSMIHGPFHLVLINRITEGQLCTVLEAKKLIDTDEDILIISSDTYVSSDIGAHIAAKKPDCAGLISVTSLPGNQWSFARTDDDGKVIEVAEKDRISDHVSTGLYYFSNGRIFVERAEESVVRGEKTKNEYYVIPLYQKYIDRGDWIGISEAKKMHDMGNPEALRLTETYFTSSQ